MRGINEKKLWDILHCNIAFCCRMGDSSFRFAPFGMTFLLAVMSNEERHLLRHEGTPGSGIEQRGQAAAHLFYVFKHIFFC